MSLLDDNFGLTLMARKFEQMMDEKWAEISLGPLMLPPDWDPNAPAAQDGEWHAVVTLPHEVVEHEGVSIPVYNLCEIDPERAAWNAARKHSRPNSRHSRSHRLR